MIEKELLQRVKKWMSGEEAPPYTVEAKLTQRCNLKCSYCGTAQVPESKYKEILDDEVSMDDWIKLVDDAGKLGVKRFIITGGEPFIRLRVIEMMYRIKKYGMEGILWTNATLFTESHIEKLVSMDWDKIIVGLDGSTQEVHDGIRGLSFNKVKENIEKINTMKQELNKNKPLLQIHFLLNRKNYRDVPNLIKFAKDLNFNHIGIAVLQPFSPNYNELLIRPTEVGEVCDCLMEAKKSASESGIIMTAPESGHVPESRIVNRKKEANGGKKVENDFAICYRPWYFVHINYQGYVEACNRSSRGEWERNLPREKFVSRNLKDIWYTGEHFKRVREMIITKNYPGFCTKLCIKDDTNDIELRNLLKNNIGV